MIVDKNNYVIQDWMHQMRQTARFSFPTFTDKLIDDYLATIALKNKSKILERSLSIVRNNIEILDKWVKHSKYVEYIRPKGGTTAFLKYDRDIKSEELCKDILEKTGVMLVPGSALDMESYLRVG